MYTDEHAAEATLALIFELPWWLEYYRRKSTRTKSVPALIVKVEIVHLQCARSLLGRWSFWYLKRHGFGSQSEYVGHIHDQLNRSPATEADVANHDLCKVTACRIIGGESVLRDLRSSAIILFCFATRKGRIYSFIQSTTLRSGSSFMDAAVCNEINL